MKERETAAAEEEAATGVVESEASAERPGTELLAFVAEQFMGMSSVGSTFLLLLNCQAQWLKRRLTQMCDNAATAP